MHILMTNHTLEYYGGSTTFIYTLAVALKNLGNRVTCYSPRLGDLAKRLQEQGINVTNDLHSRDLKEVDIIHAQHRYETLLSFSRFPDTPMIVVCHGVLPWQEQPLQSNLLNLNIYKYVAVSEEVRDHLVNNTFLTPDRIIIIRNGVDLSRFYSRKRINKRPLNLLVISNYITDERLRIIKVACEKKGVRLERIGLPAKSLWNVEDYINEADIVMSLGRGALEAMACRRNVVVYDNKGGDGLVSPENFYTLRKRNFSGRTNRITYDVSSFVDILNSYNPDNVEPLFEIVQKEHDISFIARQYLQLYAQAIESFKSQRADHVFDQSVMFRLFEETIEDFRKNIGNLEVNLWNRSRTISDLKAAIKDKERQLHEILGQKNDLQKRLQQMERSLAWRALKRILYSVDSKIFPMGTKRGAAYLKFISRIQRIFHNY